ncbi:MAG: hypothetical protein KKF56_05410 [Nanoarchaeota archaeon]|nr:hypothetical protein [Nanoarchaeota archaeon]
MSKFHKFQSVTLLIAVALLWYAPFLEQKTAIIISSSIIGVNALIELIS